MRPTRYQLRYDRLSGGARKPSDEVGPGGRHRASLVYSSESACEYYVQDSLAEWSKALAQGASPQGRGFEPHSCHFAAPVETAVAPHDTHPHGAATFPEREMRP